MKKIIVIASLFLAFSFNANAQQAAKAKSAQIEAITPESISKDITDLSKVVSMDESLKKDLTSLLYMRMDALNGVKTEDEKKAIFERYGRKFSAGFTPEQLSQFKSNKDLYQKLTQY